MKQTLEKNEFFQDINTYIIYQNGSKVLRHNKEATKT